MSERDELAHDVANALSISADCIEDAYDCADALIVAGWRKAAWQPIETAPKDGTPILLLSIGDEIDVEGERIKRGPAVALGKWWPDGDSWVDQFGQLGGDCYRLAVTGVWESGGGWFQPNEVTHWMPLPEPRSAQ